MQFFKMCTDFSQVNLFKTGFSPPVNLRSPFPGEGSIHLHSPGCFYASSDGPRVCKGPPPPAGKAIFYFDKIFYFHTN